MSEKEIIEGNKLIAEFMGGKYYDAWENKFYHSASPHYYFDVQSLYLKDKVKKELKYHASWNWLMRVVEKIEQVRVKSSATYNSDHYFNVRVSQGYVEIEGTTEKIFRNTSIEGTKIKALWLAIGEFIKWYNSQTPHP